MKLLDLFEQEPNAQFDQLYAAIYRDKSFARETSTTIERFIETIEWEYEEIIWWNPDTPNVIDTPEFWNGFKIWLRQQYERVIQKIDREVEGGYPLKVFREMTVTAKWNPTKHGVGLYWATIGHQVHAFSGKEGPGYQTILLYADVHEADINWFDTIRSRLDFMTGEEEGEIQLHPNTKIKVTRIVAGRPTYGNTDKVHAPIPNKPGIYLTTTNDKTFEAMECDRTPLTNKMEAAINETP